MSGRLVFRQTNRLEAKVDLLLNLFIKHIGPENIDKLELSEQEQTILDHSLQYKEASYYIDYIKE